MKTRESISAKLKELLVTQMGIDVSQMSPNAEYGVDLTMDSLDFIEMTMALETAFKIAIKDEDAEKWKTVKDTVDYLCQRLGAPVTQ